MTKALWIGPLLLLGAASGGGYWLHTTAPWRQAAAQLDAEVATARRIGIPFENRQLLANPPVPDDQNAALSLLEATEATKVAASHEDDVRLVVVLISSEPLPVDLIELRLRPYRQAMALARRAAALPQCDFRRNFDFGPRLEVADQDYFRVLLRRLCVQAEVNAVKGRVRDCIGDLSAARAIAVEIGKDPVLSSLDASTGNDQLVLRYVIRSMTRLEHNPAGLKALTAFVRGAPPLPDLTTYLRGEIYFGIDKIRNLGAAGNELPAGEAPANTPNPDPAELQHRGLPGGLNERAYLARYLRFWNRVLTATRGRPALEMTRTMDSEISRLERSTDPAQAITRSMAAPLKGAGNLIVSDDAARRVTAALGDVLFFRATHGRLPKTLEEAGVRDRDPFAEGPLRMVIAPGELRVYSVGEDGRDDHGKAQWETSDGGPSDIIAEFPVKPLTQRLGVVTR